MARALFQIARGVTTSSLSNGELYYNQTSQSLQVGSNSGSIITLAKLNETNSGSFKVSGDISASGNLFISGNARIVGNLTFGDSDALDTVTVVASLSSSLIPQSNSTFDLGNTTTYWKNAYITSITGSLSGSVNNINITNFSASVSSSIGNLNNTSASHQLRIDALEQHSGSVNSFTASITSSYNATSQSLNSVSSSLFNVSSSYIATSQSLNNVSASLLTFSSSQYKNDSSSFDTRLDLVESTASVLTSFSASVSTSVGLLQTFSSSQYNSDSTSFDGRLDSIENYTSSLKTAIELTGSSVTIQGDFLVRGTTTTINATIVNLSASVIQLDAGGAVNGGIEVTDKVGASTITGSMIWDVTNDIWKAGKKGSEIQVGTTIDISNLSSSLYFTDTTQSVSHSIVSASAWGAFQSASSYSASFYTTINNTTQSVLINSQSAWGAFQSASSYSASIYTRDANQDTKITEASASAWGAFQSASSYSSSFSSSLSLVSSSLQSSSIYYSSSISGTINTFSSSYKNDSSSFDTRISASTLTHNDTTGQTGIDFTKVGTQVSAIASGLTSGSNVQFNNITASTNISASGTVYCDTLVATTLVGAELPVLAYETNGTLGNILIKGATPKSIQVVDSITFTGLTQNGLDQYSATALLITGSITASLGFSGSINGIGNVTLYSTSVDSRIVINSASAWGAFQSASTYSASLAASIASSNTTILTISASAWGAFQSASSYSGSFYTTINNATQSVLINSQSAWGAFQSASSFSSSLATSISASNAAATSYSASANTTYAKLAVENTFTQNQIISGSLNVTGDITAYSTSDERLKDNIELISNPIEKVKQLRGVEFDWNDKSMFKAGKHDYGVIAQDVEKVLPELVKETHTGYLGVDYDKIIGLLIEVVKEQEKRIKELENKVGS
jgi:hypothetical protein